MTNRPLNILYVLNRLTVGGMEKRVASIALHLRREGWRVGMLCLTEGGEMEPALREAGVEIFTLGYRGARSAGPLGVWRTIRAGRRVVREFHADILQSFLPMGNIMAGLMARGTKARFIAGKVTSGFYYRKGPLYGPLENWTLRRAALVCVNAGSIRDEITRVNGVPENRIRVIHNGISAELPPSAGERAAHRRSWREKLGLGEDAVLVGVVANLYGYKGHRFIVEAASQLIAKYPRLHFVFAGRNEGEAEALRRQADELGVSPHIHMPGSVTEMRPFLAALDVMLSASFVEGFSNVWLEGMAAGLPCVFTKVGGAEEAFRDAEECLLIPVRDSAAIAAALDRVLGDEELRSALAARAVDVVRDKFSLEAMLENFKTMYRDIYNQ